MIAALRLSEATYLMQILASAFLAILFLQSGIDKILDRRGNSEWLKGHFAKSPLAAMVPALLISITILEIGAGALSAVGCVLIIVLKDPTIAFYGAIVSAAAVTASGKKGQPAPDLWSISARMKSAISSAACNSSPA